MKRFRKILALVLSFALFLTLVQMPVVISVGAASTQTKSQEYYIKVGGTGDGRTHANAAGSIPDVVATINSDGHKAGDNVTVFIDSRNGSGVVPSKVTSASDVIAYHSTDTPIHTATITYKPYDSNYEALLGYVEYGNTYNQMFLSGPTVFENLTMIDLSTNDYWYGMIFSRGYSVTYRNINWKGISASTGEIINQDSNAREYYTGNFTNGTALSCSNEQRVVWDGAGNTLYRLVFGSRITSVDSSANMHTVNGNLTLELSNTANKANTVFLSHVEPSTNLYMTYKDNVNIVMKNGCYAYCFLSNGAEDGNGYLAATDNNASYPVIEGAIQVVANAGSKWDHTAPDFTAYSSSDRTSFTPVYKIKNNDDSVVIDVTVNAGEYTVSGDKTVYVARGDKIYYGNEDINLKVPSAEEYILTSADDVEDIKADNTPMSSPSKVFLGWKDDGNGILTAKYDTADVVGSEYFIAPEGTGDGRSSLAPAGSVERVIKSINEDGLVAGDTATVYIDGTNQPDYWNSDDLNSKFIQFNSSYDHTATIVYTSLDKAKPAKIAFAADYGNNGGTATMFVTGPTVFKDVYLIDQQNSYESSRDVFANGNDITFENVKFYEAWDTTNGFVSTNPNFDQRILYLGGNWRSRWNDVVSLYGVGNGGKVKLDSGALSIENGFKRIVYGWQLTATPLVNPVFAEDATVETNGGTLNYLYLTSANSDGLQKGCMIYEKNVNLVANNKTVIKAFATNYQTISDETAAKNAAPIVKGAIQIVLNDGSSITDNSVYAYSDTAKTTKTPVFIIRNDSDTLLDVTENAGEYSVNGEKTLYTVVDNKVYYGNSFINLKVPSAGEYNVYQADSLSEIINSVTVSAPDSQVFDGWTDDGNGTLTAKFKVGEKKRYMLKVVNDGELCAPLCQNVTLEKGKTYTVSYKYKFVTGYMDYSLYFFVGNAQNYRGGDGKVYYMSCYTDTRVFDSVKYDDDIAQVEYTFTLTDRYKTNGEAYYTIPQGKSLCSTGFVFENAHKGLTTELYIADMVLYETEDENKTNLLPVTDYTKGMDGWGCQWKGADTYSSSFTHSSCDYIAAYEPLDEGMFKYSAFGDANQDKIINIIDLVRIKKLISNGKYTVTADAKKDGVLDAMDLTLLRKHLLEIEEIETLVYPNRVETGYSDAEAFALKNTVEATSDSVGSKLLSTYYVDSVSGNDSNNGKSQNSPLKTLDALSQKTLKSGDVVLFKRGSVFRSDKRIKLVSGVSYGAYGSGEKPIFMGSLKNYAECDWEDMGNGIWKLSGTLGGEAGIVTFDGNTTFGFRKDSVSQLLKNGDYYHDYKDTGSFYLKLGGKNPSDYFNNIEIGTADYAFFGIYADSNGKYQRENITVNNISFMYYGSSCIDLAYCTDIEITGCEFRYIGGNYNYSGSTRVGNAITIWNTCNGVNVNNCLFYEIFDAPFTFQGDDTYATYENISVTNCLIEYTSMNYEFWGTNVQDGVSVLNDIKFSNNIVRFGGLGFGGIQRKIKTDQGVILGWEMKYDEDDSITDFIISNNIFDTSDCYIFRTSETMPITFSGNKYYQGKSSFLTNWASSIKAVDQETLEEAIATFDTNASAIKWIS